MGKDDLQNALHDLRAPSPFLRDALFHCQQAVEKALKAFLTWHDTPFRRVHNLNELGKRCVGIDLRLADLAVEIRPLSDSALRFRYPGAQYEADQDEVNSALDIARRVLEAVLERLPQELRL